MSRVYNFSPGPCALPDDVMKTAQSEFYEYQDLQTSIMEISHRSEEFLHIYQEAVILLRELLNIPDDYWVLFLQGGATGQTAAIPMNLSARDDLTAYAVTGYWSARAMNEAKSYCQVHIAADTESGGYTDLPQTWDIPSHAVYMHYADNETIEGIEFPTLPDSPVPLVADMSSNILSRQIRVADYALIYAGAQKNMGPAGITIVIVRADKVRPRNDTPSVFNYDKQHRTESMYNTPPTFQIYMVGLVLKWLKKQGGVAAMEKRNKEKSAALYEYLDSSDFYQTPAVVSCRSRMNVPFFLPNQQLTDAFLAEATTRGLIGLKGHKARGGCRASLYNAMPMDGVISLIDHLRDFERRCG